MSERPLLSVRGLGVAYRSAGRMVEVLAGVDLDLSAGERLAVIGESGSGKSTLALAVAGLLPPEARPSGSIAWPGLAEPPAAGRDIGFVFQDPSSSLDPVLTVGEQIGEVLVTHPGLGWREAYARSAELLRRVAIAEPERALRAYPHQFSGGQRQRIAIAMAIAAGPKLLIADEATSALDTVIQAEIAALLESLVAERGMALIFITHDIALASNHADSIAVFYAGRLVETGKAAQVLARPQHPYTAALIGAHVGLDGPVRQHLPVIPGTPPNLVHPPKGCRYAPRCPLAEPRCMAAEPAWRGAAGAGAACIHAGEASVAA